MFIMSSGKTGAMASREKAVVSMLVCVTRGLCHMAAEFGWLEPSSIMSWKAPWLAVLIADGDEPSSADSFAPENIMELSIPMPQPKSSSSIGLFPANGFANRLKGDAGIPMLALK